MKIHIRRVSMERLTELKCDITKLDAKIKNMQERIDKMAFDDKEEVGIKFLASTVSYLNELREYKQLEEQGLLLRLPLKIGDTVYSVTRDFISEYTICSIEKYNEGFFFNWKCEKGIYINVRGFTEYDIGKTVFLTQAEAEQKLKEMNTDNGITE